MIKNGAQKTYPDRRDFDFLKSHSHLFGAVDPLPAEFNVDIGRWMPNQNAQQQVPNPIAGYSIIPAWPYGCTTYTSTDVAMDAQGTQLNPLNLDAITHANAAGGYDVRAALSACLPPTTFNPNRLGWIRQFFRIVPQPPMDFFDAARMAMFVNQSEKRSVSVGSPWYWDWEPLPPTGILLMPQSIQKYGSWHNSVICGWTTINGVLYLKGKSWQGPDAGDHGFHYFSREVFNSVMSVAFTCMFTVSDLDPALIKTVDTSVVTRIVAWFHFLFNA